MLNDPTNAVDSPKDFGTGAGASARRWISELELSEKDQLSWSTRAKKIIRRYRDEREPGTRTRRFAILWSNIQTLGPAIYARTPQPIVSRRFKDDDPVGRVASEVLERALAFSVDAYDFDGVMRLCRDEFLLLARGQVWERYEPHFRTVTPQVPVTRANAEVLDEGVSVTDDVEAGEYQDATGKRYPADQVQEGPDGAHAEGEAYEEVEYEEARCDHVSWDDFGTNPARTWEEVRYVWRRAYLTREELVERFGKEIGNAVPLDWIPKGSTQRSGEPKDQQFRKAAVYEIWDKPSRKAVWVSKSYAERLLDERDDPLNLQGFFPCPRPLLGTCTPDSVIPIPDFVYYQDQAEELDQLTARIGKLIEALRMVGFYAGQQSAALQNVFQPGIENTLIPVDGWANFKEGGGIKGLIEWVPLDLVMTTLKACFETRAQILQDVYEITGVSDILRGSSDPNETATAQGIKAQWGSVRVRDRQKELARFSRDILRIKGEIIAEKFSVDTLKAMTGLKMFDDEQAKSAAQQQIQMQAQQAQAMQQPFQPPAEVLRMLDAPTWAEVKALLSNNALRQFRVEIETDSTIEPNETEEKQRRVEFVRAISEFMGAALPAVQAAPALMPLVAETLKFLARGFRCSREMEDVIDKAAEQIQEAGSSGAGQQAPQGPPPPDPADQKAKLMAAQARVMDAQTNQQRVGLDAQYDQADLGLRQRQQQIDVAALQRDPNPQLVTGG